MGIKTACFQSITASTLSQKLGKIFEAVFVLHLRSFLPFYSHKMSSLVKTIERFRMLQFARKVFTLFKELMKPFKEGWLCGHEPKIERILLQVRAVKLEVMECGFYEPGTILTTVSRPGKRFDFSKAQECSVFLDTHVWSHTVLYLNRRRDLKNSFSSNLRVIHLLYSTRSTTSHTESFLRLKSSIF